MTLKHQTLYITDPNDNILAVLDNKYSSSCPYMEPEFTEKLNGEITFEFQIPADHPDAEHVKEENTVKFWDENDVFQEFVIKEVDDEHGDGIVKTVICEHSIGETLDNIVKDKRPSNTDAGTALDGFLADTIGNTPRWIKGQIDALGNATPSNVYYEPLRSGILKLLEAYQAEQRFRVVPNENTIGSRYIDLLVRRGSDTGRRFEYTRDIVSIKRTVNTFDLKTAMIGRGKGEESGDGYGRRIDFSDVSWSVANGDPADKPLGQNWIGDPEALDQFGRNNGTVHRVGLFEDMDEEDPAVLLRKTWEYLQTVNKPRVTYEVKAIDLGTMLGIDHEKIQLGDTVVVIDREFKPAIMIEARIIELKRVKGKPEATEIVLGNFIPLFSDDSNRLDNIEKTINDNRGGWDTATNPIVDADFPDTKPPTPTNFNADGLFKSIVLKWDYNATSYISAYEIYASQVSGFTPDISNRVWRGKAGGYVHNAGTNQTWYFKIRAINTHETPSDMSAQISAKTIQVAEADIAPYTITNNLIAENANIDWAKIGNIEVTDAHVTGQLSANKVTIGAGTAFDSGYDPSTKETPTGAQEKADASAKSYTDGVRDDLNLTAPLPTEVKLDNNGVTAGSADLTKYARMDYRGLYVKGGAIQIDGGLAETNIASASKWNSKETPEGAQAKVDAVKIGGTNLIDNSKGDKLTGWRTWGDNRISVETVYDKQWIYSKKGVSTSQVGAHTPEFDLKAGVNYIVGFDIKSYYNSGYDLNYLYLRSYETGTVQTIKKLSSVDMRSGFVGDISGKNGLRVWFPVSHDVDVKKAVILIAITGVVDDAGFLLKEVMIEEGTKPTTWSYSPKETEQIIATAETNAKGYVDDRFRMEVTPSVYVDRNIIPTDIPVGGIFTGGFIKNASVGATVNPGEILIKGGSFVHPVTKAVIAIPDGTEVQTQFESGRTGGALQGFIVYVGSDWSRFSSHANTSGVASDKFVFAYKSGSTWYYDGNNGYYTFTPNSNDAIVARVDGATQIDKLIPYYTARNGVYMDENGLYAGTIRFDQAVGGTAMLGGTNNENGRLIVMDSQGDTVADLNAEDGGFHQLYVGTLTSPSVYNVNSDNKTFGVTGNVEGVLQGLERLNNATVTIRFDADISEDIEISNFLGNGSIKIDLNGYKLNGSVYIVGNSPQFINIANGTINSKDPNKIVQVDRCTYVRMDNVKMYGNNASQRGVYVHGGSSAYFENCEIYDTVDSAFAVATTGDMAVRNCKGDGGNIGVHAFYGGYAYVTGTIPGGTSAIQEYSGEVSGSYTVDYGSATPPPPPETTKTWTSVSADNWGTMYGWANEGVPKQGDWGYGTRTGYWYFPSDMVTTLTGKTIKSMKLYLKRKSEGGYSSDVPIKVSWHEDQTKPAGTPDTNLTSETTTVNLSWGESATIALPTSFFNNFQTGQAKGVGVYNGSGKSNYAILEATAKLTVTYS